MDLNAWLADRKLIVCVGSGGVGKTTTAAAVGLWAAMEGRRCMVLTIDPAKRLANSLGLNQFGNEEMRIDLSSMPPTDGELWAMMLDSRTTFDDLITRMSPDPDSAERILENHVYRHMADTFAGSQDYMATEKLHDLVMNGRYDLVVLDTPPVKNALDFLESPGRLMNFLDERILKWFLAPYNSKMIFGKRLMMGTSAIMFRLLGHMFGRDFLDDLTEFFVDFQVLYDGFRERHAAVIELFRRPDTAFVTVCAPTESSVNVAQFFQEELRHRNLPRGGVVVNQVHSCQGQTHNAFSMLHDEALEVANGIGENTVRSVLARLGMAHHRLQRLTIAEAALTKRVRASAVGGGFYQEIPRLEGQVHDLPALHEVGHNLFAIQGVEL